MRWRLCLGLLLVINGANGIGCDGGTLSYSESACTSPNFTPDCVWIQNNLDAICGSTLTNSDVVKVDDTCYVNGATCSQVSEFSDTPNTFCCAPASLSPSASPQNTPVAQISALASASVLKSATPSASCAYRIYNSSNDFSGTQGQNGWYYGYNNGGVFSQFTVYQTSGFTHIPSWFYDINAWTQIGHNIIIPNMAGSGGAGYCSDFGNLSPVLQWIPPSNLCYQDVTISLYLSPKAAIGAALTVNGNVLYLNSNLATSYSYSFNVYGISSLQLEINPYNNGCNDPQTQYSLIITPIGVSNSVLPSISSSSSYIPFVQPSSSSVKSATATATCPYRVYNAASDFSGTQGRNGWYYGYYSGSTFTQFTAYQTTPFTSSLAWNYNANSYGYITPNIIMPNGASTCGTPAYGNIIPVLRWHNPIGSCLKDVTISLTLSPGTTSVLPSFIVNGNTLYSPTSASAYTNTFNVYDVSSIELSVGPLNGNCNSAQTTFSLNIAPIGPSATTAASRSLSPSALMSASSFRTNSISASSRTTPSTSSSGTNTGSVSVSRSPSRSATGTATVFYTGNWTDYGPAYWNVPLSNTGSETISECMIRCSQTPSCGGISVNTPCQNIALNSPAIYTTTCANCFIMPMEGVGSGTFVSNTGWQSFIYYDKMFPPTETSRASVTSSASAVATSKVVTNSTLDICVNWGRSVTLPFIDSSVTIMTNAPGTNYVNGLGCSVYIYGAGTAQMFDVFINGFSSENGRDYFRIYNSVGQQIYANSGNLGGGWHLYFQGPFIQISFTSDASNVASGISAVVSLIYGSDTASPSVSGSVSVSSRGSGSIRSTGSITASATASATEFYTGNWTDLGRYNYANANIDNLGAMTINRCKINCWQNPLCGLIVVTSPCNTIDLDSSLVHTTVCGECWLKLTSGWVISTDAVSRSIMLYDRVYPPTTTSRGSLTSSVSSLPSPSLALSSSYDMCSASGTSITLPIVGSSVILRTNPIGGQYGNNLACNFFIHGGTGKRFLLTYQAFRTEVCCDALIIFNSLGTQVNRDAGVIDAGTTRYISDTSFIRVNFITDNSVLDTGVVVKIELEDVPTSVTGTGTYSYSTSMSPSVSSRALVTQSVSVVNSGSSVGSPTTSFTTVSRNTPTVSNSPAFSQSSSRTASVSPGPSMSPAPINSFYSSISSDGSSSFWVSYSSGGSVSVSSNTSYSMCYSDSNSPDKTDSPSSTKSASLSVGHTRTPNSITACPSISITPSYSICPSHSIAPTISATTSASNIKPAGPPPALPANLSALSLTALSGLFNDMANYPPALIGDNLQKLGMAALANSPDGEFGISTSVFSVKIKAMNPDSGNSSAVPLSVGKTGIVMPKVSGAAAASAIQWTSDPYNSAVAPDSMVLSLNVLDSGGKKVVVKNSSAPIIIKMNLIPALDDPRFLPPPIYLADCTKGEIYKKSGPQFLDAREIVNSTGYHKWNVPCLLDDWRPLNCSNSDSVLTYTCPPLIFTPKCQYWDSALATWSSDGCTPTFSNATLMICSCTHLTDFSSRMNAVAQGNKAIFANAGNVYSIDGLIKFAQWYGNFRRYRLIDTIIGLHCCSY
jgi:hypothetical protein